MTASLAAGCSSHQPVASAREPAALDVQHSLGWSAACPLQKAMAADRAVNHLSTLDELGPQWTGLSSAFDAADDDVTYWERAVAAADSREGRQALEQAKVLREKARCSMVQFLDKLELP